MEQKKIKFRKSAGFSNLSIAPILHNALLDRNILTKAWPTEDKQNDG